MSRTKLRKDLLRQHSRVGGIKVRPPVKKSLVMRMIESRYDVPLEQLLWSAPAEVLADAWDLSIATIYAWRRKFPEAKIAS